MNNKIHDVVMQSPEIIGLDNELSQLQNQVDSNRLAWSNDEEAQNNFNMIMANHTGYQPQSVYDEAKQGYHAKGKSIAQLDREYQELKAEYDSLYRQRGELYRKQYTRESQKQYEALTINDLEKQNRQLAKKVAELTTDANKVRASRTELEKVASEQDMRQSGLDRYEAEYLALKRELEQAEADRAIDSSLPNPTGLRRRIAEAKSKYEYCLKHLPTQALLNSIANKRESLQGEIDSIEADIESLTSEIWANRGLIAQIQYREKLYELLIPVKEMIVCDNMSNDKSKVGHNLLDKLQNKGLSLPVEFDNMPSIFNGILDNLDEEKARIEAEIKDL